MIRRLRDRHRRLIPLIAILAALSLGMAIAGRRSAHGDHIPAALQSHREAP